MRLLLIDDSEEFRLRVVHMLAGALPDADVEQWNPASRGQPGADFGWTQYDALLLADEPWAQDGIAWLRALRRQTRLPPTLILAGTGGEDQAVRAIKAGASDYLRKADLTPARLVAAIKDALLDAVHTGRAGDTLQRTQPVDVAGIGRPASSDDVRIDGYRVLRRIGEGGMAKVYLALREADGAQVVLKVLDPKVVTKDGEFLQRFEREYRVISRVQNEHVVSIYDHGFSGRHAWLAMEYFPGGDLKQRLREGFTSMAALKVLMQIARALDAVHTAGVVHRDIKPQNIMFRDNGRLALVDFGLAKEVDVDSTLTAHGLVLATPLYMSPEQCQGHTHDARGDLYSVGILLHEMLTGAHPFTAVNAPELAWKHVNEPVPRLPARLSGYQGIVDRLLAKRPEDRFQTARDLFAYIAH